MSNKDIPSKYGDRLSQLAAECSQELDAILNWWMKYVMEQEGGVFYGEVSVQNEAITMAPKGTVLACRLLWTFFAAYRFTRDTAYREQARRVYEWISTHMMDPKHGGIYWTVTAAGEPLDSKKQIYAQAFAVYAFSEYALATSDERAAKQARELWQTIGQKAASAGSPGYEEALSREWDVLPDNRLSEREPVVARTTNTHLHLLEAFANLYDLIPEPALLADVEVLLQLFDKKIIVADGSRQELFFDEYWKPLQAPVSFGHDIESSWLLLQATERTNNASLIGRFRQHAITLAKGAAQAQDEDGGLWYEWDTIGREMVREKHWWPQAEAMPGFLNAWQLSADTAWLDRTFRVWDFIKMHIRDQRNGEWFWGVNAAGQPMTDMYKAGLWKCPYHNARACLEVLQRLQKIGIS